MVRVTAIKYRKMAEVRRTSLMAESLAQIPIMPGADISNGRGEPSSGALGPDQIPFPADFRFLPKEEICSFE